jgi:phage N-6-adenine-methyltransferase
MTPRDLPSALTDSTRALAEVQAGKAAAAIMVAEKAEQAARLIKDPTALEGALIAKLDAQRDFAAQYVALFPHGVRLDRRDDSSVGSTNAVEFCHAHLFHIRTVQRWCELLDPANYVAKKKEILRRCWELAELLQSASFSSASAEWYTPAPYVEAARAVLGQIDLDPASSEQANATVRAAKFFSKKDDGLAREWSGRAFLNPPYGRLPDGGSLAAEFCNKAVDEFRAERVEACIILVNSLHSQSWQAPLFEYPICLVDHRIQFISADGEENKNPTFQNMFVYLGRDVGKFADLFSRFGYVVSKIERATERPA